MIEATKVCACLQSGLNLISLPLPPSNGSWEDLFAGAVPERISGWDGERQRAVQSPRPELGRGYWVQMPDLASIYMEGVPASLIVTLDLYPGENLIGNPFPVPVLWDIERIRIQRLDGMGMSLQRASSSGLVCDWGLTWDPIERRMVFIRDLGRCMVQGTLGEVRPFMGFWFVAFERCQLIISMDD